MQIFTERDRDCYMQPVFTDGNLNDVHIQLRIIILTCIFLKKIMYFCTVCTFLYTLLYLSPVCAVGDGQAKFLCVLQLWLICGSCKNLVHTNI